MKKNKIEGKFYVYGHFTRNGDIFYIGVGTNSGKQSDKVKMVYPRAYHFKNRTKFWKNVKNKYGIVVKILSTHHTKEESLKEEKRLISIYGRRCKDKNGCLTNLSEGGEVGPIGFTFVMKQEQRDLLSEIKSHTFYIYSKEGEFLKSIKGKKRTAEFCGVTPTAIHSCLSTKNYTNGYFVFKEYKGETLGYTYRNLNFKPHNIIRVSSESPEGVITEHDSIKACAKFLGRDRKSVEGAINRGDGTCNKHKIRIIQKQLIMTREESVQLFNEIKDYLQANGFTTPPERGVDGKYNYRGNYMLFNCPHMCSSVRLLIKNSAGQYRILVEDIRTSFAKPLEWNRELSMNFINKVIQKLNDEDNAISGGI